MVGKDRLRSGGKDIEILVTYKVRVEPRTELDIQRKSHVPKHTEEISEKASGIHGYIWSERTSTIASSS